MNQVVNLKK